MAPSLTKASWTGCSFPYCARPSMRSEEHTSELQSRSDLVCRLLLEKKKKIERQIINCRLRNHAHARPRNSVCATIGADQRRFHYHRVSLLRMPAALRFRDRDHPPTR